MALRVRITRVGAANARYLVKQATIRQGGLAQFGPVPPLATRDHVVNGGEGEALMIEMAMMHGGAQMLLIFDVWSVRE